MKSPLIVAAVLAGGVGVGYWMGYTPAASTPGSTGEAVPSVPTPLLVEPVRPPEAPSVPAGHPPESAAPARLPDEARRRSALELEHELPSSDGLPDLVTALSETAQRSGLRLTGIEHGESLERDGYREHPVGLRVTGTYRELLGFLRAITERYRRIVNVRSLVVARGELPVEKLRQRYIAQDAENDPRQPAPNEVAQLMRTARAFEEALQVGAECDVRILLAVFTYTGKLGPAADAPIVVATTPHPPWDAQRTLFLGSDADPSQGFVRGSVGAKRDPFEPALWEGVPRIEVPEGNDTVQLKSPVSPTQRFRVSDYRLDRVAMATRKPRAWVEDPEGQTHEVGVGDKLGNNGGRISGIDCSELAVKEGRHGDRIVLRVSPPRPPPQTVPAAPLIPVGPAARSHASEVDLGVGFAKSRSRTLVELRHGRDAVPGALMFLSYVLQRLDNSLSEEAFATLTVLWTPVGLPLQDSSDAWEPRRVWITAVSIHDGAVVLRGEAYAHEDVAMLVRRLETGVYFTKIQMVRQTTKDEPSLGLSYVEFEVRAGFNEDPSGLPTK